MLVSNVQPVLVSVLTSLFLSSAKARAAPDLMQAMHVTGFSNPPVVSFNDLKMTTMKLEGDLYKAKLEEKALIEIPETRDLDLA